MRPSGNCRRLAGVVAVAAVTAACASSPAASSPAALGIACTAVPYASAPAAGTGGQPSQWDMPPVRGGLDGVAARSPGSAVAVGWTGPPPTAPTARTRALVARWNGVAWRTLSSGALPPDSFLFAAALFPGGAWAVGDQGMAEHGRVFFSLMVRVTGATARQVPVPQAGDGRELDDVAATSATDAWAVGGYALGGPLVLHWNGTAWTRVLLPAAIGRVAGEVNGVAATSATDAWAVMRTDGGPRIAHWDGRRWADVVAPRIGTGYDLKDVAATSATDVWAVGAGVILHWDGRSWTCYRTPNNLVAVSASSAGNAWAVGSSGYGTGAVTLHWNGHTWTQVMIPHQGPETTTGWKGVAVIPRSGHAWAVGSTGNAGATQMWYWNGTAWQ